MAITPIIEVAVPPETSTTERGDVLERFADRFLKTQNYHVTQKIRVTGMEIDLLAKEISTGEEIIVECKAHRQTISADVIAKLVGNVTIRGASSGWLLSTFALSKDAKGIALEWNKKAPEQRRRLQIYDPPKLVDRLVAANVVVAPESLNAGGAGRIGEEVYLLLTQHSEYWALTVLDQHLGIPIGALLFDARSGNRITDDAAISLVSESESSLATLTWLKDTSQPNPDDADRLRIELGNIVSVPIAENWADYRPARPKDFIGREDLEKSIFDWFDNIRNGSSSTRLLAIKGPSGWGKSSFVLKLAAHARNIRKRNRVFIYAVDSRAATSRRFGELALSRAITEASASGFISPSENASFGSADSPFSTEYMSYIVKDLAAEQKVICLIFDQFEELLYKQELAQVFDEIRALCNAIDAAQENIAIGFSWKTDGSIPTEHGAYHLWHGLADRRLEFELKPFSNREVTVALNQFQRELGSPLAPQLRRLLRDHCQGYPWLLKKLCIHVLELVRAGMAQSDVLSQSLSINALFDRDLQLLDQAEASCVKKICADSPAEFFEIQNSYGDDVVVRLLSKRLIVRSGTRLSIYWDIFRDYVLTQRVPSIPINYVPQANFTNYVVALRMILRADTCTYDELARELGVSKGTADNIVRDLVMIGHAQTSRTRGTVSAVQHSEEAAAKTLLAFFRSHIVYQRLLQDTEADLPISETTIKKVMERSIDIAGLSPSIVEMYAQKLLRWFRAVGLVETSAESYYLRPSTQALSFISKASPTYLRRGLHMFLAESPPKRAVEVLYEISHGEDVRQVAKRPGGRNAVATLNNLGLIDDGGTIIIETAGRSAELLVKESASSTQTITFVREVLKHNPRASGEDVGGSVAERFDFTWAPGSKRRYGTALKQWVQWLYPDIVEDSAAIRLEL